MAMNLVPVHVVELAGKQGLTSPTHSLCLTQQQLSHLQRRQKTPQGSGGNSSIDCRGQTGLVLTVDVTYPFLSFQCYFYSRVALTFEVKHDSRCTVLQIHHFVLGNKEMGGASQGKILYPQIQPKEEISA